MTTPAPTQWTDPIIIIGAGRSGTTRLTHALAAHPDVYMLGETAFVLPRLWQTFHERPAYVRNWRLGQLAQQTRPEWRAQSWGEFWTSPAIDRNLANLGPALADIEVEETTRLQRAFGAFIAEALIPPALRRPRWGFKEIWGGSSHAPTDWSVYLGAFPAAYYVHSIRHPLDYVRSTLSHNRRADLGPDTITHELREWVAMVRHARQFTATGRYIEFRMEDFDARVSAVLSALGLTLDPAVTRVAAIRHLPSERRALTLPPGLADAVAGLAEICAPLGYALPD